MTHILEDVFLKFLARVLLALLGLLWDGLRLRLGGEVRAQVLAQVGLPPIGSAMHVHHASWRRLIGLQWAVRVSEPVLLGTWTANPCQPYSHAIFDNALLCTVTVDVAGKACPSLQQPWSAPEGYCCVSAPLQMQSRQAWTVLT